MSGHSKWAQIKHQKSATDAARSRVFSRYARLITLESKKAHGLVSTPGLSAAISRAKAVNMPKENIERAITKGTSKEASSLEQVVYEAYGPGGVAILIEALTDNKNRTTQEIKHLLLTQGIELANPGAASWAFTKTGSAYIPNEPLIEILGTDDEHLSRILESLDAHEDIQQMYTNARGFEGVSE